MVRTREAVGGSGWAGTGEPPAEIAGLIDELEVEMRLAAAELRFEEAALLRDELVELRLSGGVPVPLAVTEPDGGDGFLESGDVLATNGRLHASTQALLRRATRRASSTKRR